MFQSYNNKNGKRSSLDWAGGQCPCTNLQPVYWSPQCTVSSSLYMSLCCDLVAAESSLILSVNLASTSSNCSWRESNLDSKSLMCYPIKISLIVLISPRVAPFAFWDLSFFDIIILFKIKNQSKLFDWS